MLPESIVMNNPIIQLNPRKRTNLTDAKTWARRFTSGITHRSLFKLPFYGGHLEWVIYPAWTPVWADQNIEHYTRCKSVGLTILENKDKYLRGCICEELVAGAARARRTAYKYLHAVTAMSDEPRAFNFYYQKRHDISSPRLGTFEWKVLVDLKRPVFAGTWQEFVATNFKDVCIEW